MSEWINNSETRKQKLQELIKSLHEGKTVDEVKEAFKTHFGDVSTTEISQIEQALVKEGLPIEEVQRLCDVHASVFDGSISEIHQEKDFSKIPGHPTHVMTSENRAIEALITEEIQPYLDAFVTKKDNMSHLMLRIGLDRLSQIDRHYGRKEYLMFPYLEKHGITAPPKVMWGVDDEIRNQLKQCIHQLNQVDIHHEEVKEEINALLQKIKDMIFKEDHILIPLMLETFSYYEWIKIDQAMPEYGYTLVEPTQSWAKKPVDSENEPKEELLSSHHVRLDAGSLNATQINALLNTLPFDMTFVDEQDNVAYFTQGKERIFERPKTIIGRNVSMCHPPHSVHVVESILADFKSGKKEHEDFWIQMRGQFVHIRYFAVRDKEGRYLGTLEVTQDIKPIRDLQGEKRLVE